MSQNYTDTLGALRARIDHVDDQLMQLLKERIGIIHEVAALKREHTPAACHIRPGREGEMHRRIRDAFSGSDFPVAAALVIWRQIIGASTHLESPITIAVAGDSEHLSPAAREYFGRSVRCISASSIEASLEAVKSKQATIGLLPYPTSENISHWAALLNHPTLRVFAGLPVVLADDEQFSCLAVAEVQPESSGDDISLVIRNANETLDAGTVIARNENHTLYSIAGISSDTGCIGTLPSAIIDSSLHAW